MTSNHSNVDDNTLFEQWRKGDTGAFSTLYLRNKDKVYSFILRMTSDPQRAEDLMQETFFAAMRNADQFDASKSFISWMFGIAHKRTIDFFRHRKVEDKHEENAGGSVGSKIESPEDATINHNVRDIINEIVDTLEPNQREVFLLREVGGVAFKDIAQIMDCPINTALGRMRLALKNIKNEIKKRGIYGVQ
jgi:RNA polymerase sigma-70 factor (ECF subfamily)